MPNTWPADWDEQVAGAGCVLCRSIGAGDSDFALVVAAGKFCEVHLEPRSALPGYCMVVWSGAHAAEPSDLDPESAAGYWGEVMDVGRALNNCFSPMKINYLSLGNTIPHIHTHVVPRYRDDPAPGGPIGWADMFQAERRPADELRRHVALIRTALGSSARSNFSWSE